VRFEITVGNDPLIDPPSTTNLVMFTDAHEKSGIWPVKFVCSASKVVRVEIEKTLDGMVPVTPVL